MIFSQIRNMFGGKAWIELFLNWESSIERIIIRLNLQAATLTLKF